MRKTIILATALLFAFSLQAADLTVDEILARNTEAKGGLEKLRALQSLRFTGKLAVGGAEGPFTMTKKRPGMMKIEFTVQGMTGSQAYDGSKGWMIMPFYGKKDPEEMSGDMLKDFKEEAEFDGPFVDYAKKGHKVELLGKADLEGTPAYKLKLTKKEGSESIVYLDAETFLEVRVEAKRKIQGQEIDTETTYSNYQEVDGYLFAFALESKVKGAPTGQTFTLEKAEINPAVDEASFQMPAVKAPETVKQ